MICICADQIEHVDPRSLTQELALWGPREESGSGMPANIVLRLSDFFTTGWKCWVLYR